MAVQRISDKVAKTLVSCVNHRRPQSITSYFTAVHGALDLPRNIAAVGHADTPPDRLDVDYPPGFRPLQAGTPAAASPHPLADATPPQGFSTPPVGLVAHLAADTAADGQAQPGAMAAAQQQAAASAGSSNAAPLEEQVGVDVAAALAEPDNAAAAARAGQADAHAAAAPGGHADAHAVAAGAHAGHANADAAAEELPRIDEATLLRNPPDMRRYQALVTQLATGYVNMYPDNEEEDGWDSGGPAEESWQEREEREATERFKQMEWDHTFFHYM